MTLKRWAHCHHYDKMNAPTRTSPYSLARSAGTSGKFVSCLAGSMFNYGAQLSTSRGVTMTRPWGNLPKLSKLLTRLSARQIHSKSVSQLTSQ